MDEHIEDYTMRRATDEYKNKYINFKTNGRLFPTWVVRNFKNYKLPEIIKRDDEDPCKPSSKTNLEMHKYQKFLTKYMSYNSPYKDILLYHGLGSGKTATAINIYNALYNHNPAWNVFILIKAVLKDQTWMVDLERWLEKEDKEHRMKNIYFVHYDSPTANKQFMEKVRMADSAKKSLYIIDEAHNFISNVYSNINSQAGKRAQEIYDYIIQDKRENTETRVLLLTGTPAINSPFELSLLFNLLRPNIFPSNETEFNNLFISSGEYKTMNDNKKNLFQRRIIGLVSFYIGATPDRYASKKLQYLDVNMSEYHSDIYKYYENLEDKMNMSMSRGGTSTTYKSYTRQSCNFVFPDIDQHVTGRTRPRPSKFKLTEREAKLLSEQNPKLEKLTAKQQQIEQYKQTAENFVKSFDRHIGSYSDKDKKENKSIYDDFKVYIKKYNRDFNRFAKEEKNTSNLFKELYKCSAKFVNVIFNILESKGPTLVYSNYVLMEGFQVFKVYLKYFGFYNAVEESRNDGKGYLEFHGGVEMSNRSKSQKMFNQPENIKGDIAKIMMVSPAGTEGLSLLNVRQVHIIEPYWHEVRVNQMIGRAIRQCSHKMLPMEERHVDVFRYKSVKNDSSKITTDQYIENLARTKDSLIQSFLDALKEVAVDCALNVNHNMMQDSYKCFQFEEPALFEKYVGPAYIEDINDDIMMDNGLNAYNTMVERVKVIKITAVILLNDDLDNARFGDPYDYWLYPETGTVYDFEFKQPYGKILFDDKNNIPVKTNKNEYVIDYVIPVPTK